MSNESKALELAERVTDNSGTDYQKLHDKWRKQRQENANLQRAYQRLLSAAPSQQAPVAQGEPVAWMCDVLQSDGLMKRELSFIEPPENGTFYSIRNRIPLYTTPQQAIEPMTDELIDRELRAHGLRSSQPEDWFHEGVRFAERHHQIKGKQ